MSGKLVPISLMFKPSLHCTQGVSQLNQDFNPRLNSRSNFIPKVSKLNQDFHPSNMRPGSDSAPPCPFTKPAPLLLYGYGAYGISWDPSFSVTDFSLCDRGVVFAIAHVRGGGELGRSWYKRSLILPRNCHNITRIFTPGIDGV
jgi:Prolyl oligopeptidase family